MLGAITVCALHDIVDGGLGLAVASALRLRAQQPGRAAFRRRRVAGARGHPAAHEVNALPRTTTAACPAPTQAQLASCSHSTFVLCNCVSHAEAGLCSVIAAHPCGRAVACVKRCKLSTMRAATAPSLTPAACSQQSALVCVSPAAGRAGSSLSACGLTGRCTRLVVPRHHLDCYGCGGVGDECPLLLVSGPNVVREARRPEVCLPRMTCYHPVRP